MAIREWRIDSPIPHEVRMEHDWIAGRVKLVVDGQLVFERPRKLLDCGFRQQFSIDHVTLVVLARPSITTCFWYSLTQIELTDQIVDLVPIHLTHSKWISDACIYGGAWCAAFVSMVLFWMWRGL